MRASGQEPPAAKRLGGLGDDEPTSEPRRVALPQARRPVARPAPERHETRGEEQDRGPPRRRPAPPPNVRLECLRAVDAAPPDWKPPWDEAQGKSELASLMVPQDLARRVLPQVTYENLMRFALTGCEANCGDPWDEETLQTALARGPSKSALTPEAVEVLWEDLTYQEKAGFVKIVPAAEILGQGRRPVNLKISPVAVIPQVGRRPRIILNLSAQVKVGGTRRKKPRIQPSVNETTEAAEDQEAVLALGHTMRSLVLMCYDVECTWSIVWQKIDLSDGFWRMVVSAGAAYNFVYQLPRRPGDQEDYYVVPGALQMGWKNSPAYFCTATEATRELVLRLLALTAATGIAEPHRHEDHAGDWSGAANRAPLLATALILIKVFVDDFMAGIATPPDEASRPDLGLWVTRGAMHGIHATFPPTRRH